MASDHETNRSSAFTPEQLAAVTAMTSAAVKEAVSGVFASLAPVLQSIAVTPEKLREANRPYVDPAKAAREARESKLWREEIEEQRKNLLVLQENCLHQDDNGRSSIQLVHNYPDRQPRGLCVKCQALIHPKEWRIGAPDDKNPRGVPYLVEPHKDYRTVMQLESRA